MPHNIDLHDVIGQGGGVIASLTIPCNDYKFFFQAPNPDLYEYYCANSFVGMCIADGMYGRIYV